jgi:aspartate ammonia-lyase
MPIVTLKLIESVDFTGNAVNALNENASSASKPRRLVAKSWWKIALAMVTALAPVIGYDAAARSPTKRLPPARAFDSWRSSKKCCPKINSTALGSWSMTMPGVEKQQ